MGKELCFVSAGGVTFRRLDLLGCSSSEMFLFVQQQKGGHSQVLPPQQLYALLSSCSVLYYDVVQSSTCGADCNVVLLVDGTQVS